MSRIYFHGIDDTAEVYGSERAHFGVFIDDLTMAILGRYAEEYGGEKSILRSLFPPEHYASRSDKFEKDFRYGFNFIEEVILNGGRIDSLAIRLNTGLTMGTDFVKLAARIHGQCEIHTYVEGKNRTWLANIIRQGRQSGFYRDDAGWEDVIALLEKSDDSPIVTSYSVCEQFPNEHIAGWQPPTDDNGEENWDAWYDIPDDEQWNMAVESLRSSRSGLEMKPDNWERFYFGSGHNANTLLAELLNGAKK